MITVRRASTDDLEPLTSAYTAAWREGFRDMFSALVFIREDFDQERQEECRQALLDDSIDVYVAEHDGYVVGYSGVADRGDESEVVALWVHPHAWGSGAGPALLATIEDRHRNVGRMHLRTWLPEDSPRARRAFEKAGWKPSGEIGDFEHYPNEPNRTFEYTRTLV